MLYCYANECIEMLIKAPFCCRSLARTLALYNTRLISLSERRSDACVKFVMGISEGNLLFPLVYNHMVKSTAQYAL